MSRKPKQEGNSRIRAEQEQLRQAEAELARKKAEVEAQLSRLPGKVEATRKREQEIKRISVTTVATGEMNGRRRGARNVGPEPRRPSELRRGTRQAQMKFLLLCLILLTILMLLWRTVPSS